MSRKLHVCFVCNELPPATAGGIGPCVLTTAKCLAEMGHSVTVVGLYERNYLWEHPGVTVRPVIQKMTGLSLAGRVLRTMTERVRLRRFIAEIHREKKIDVVEWPDFQGLYYRSIPGVADVVRNHGGFISHRVAGLIPRKVHQEWLELHTLRAIENWIGISNWFMNEWLRISGAKPRRKVVLYNPVNCELFRPLDQHEEPLENFILYSGSIMERKGAFALAKAARIFLGEFPGVKLMFAGRDGSGTGRQRILQEVGEEHAVRVQFSDPLPQHELASLMRRSTVFAMPSVYESFCNVWGEAMASGIPVLGSKLSCGPEVVPDGEAGLLVDPHSPEETAQGVIRLLRDPEYRRHLGANGRKLAVDRYSTDVIMPRAAEFYQSCVEA